MTKTLTFAAMHFTVAFTVAWLLTGDFIVGGLVALVEPAVNTVAYHLHEKFWQEKAADQNSEFTSHAERAAH
jgi:uncharacterized membrane protein